MFLLFECLIWYVACCDYCLFLLRYISFVCLSTVESRLLWVVYDGFGCEFVIDLGWLLIFGVD